MDKNIAILLLEDNEHYIELFTKALNSAGYTNFDVANNVCLGMTFVNSKQYGVIIADYGDDGNRRFSEVVESIKGKKPRVIVLNHGPSTLSMWGSKYQGEFHKYYPHKLSEYLENFLKNHF